MARLRSGLCGSLAISVQSARLMRPVNLFASYVGRLTMARISPFVGIQRHHGAAFVLHRELSDCLEVQIQSRSQIFPRNRGFGILHLTLAAHVVDQHALLAVHAAELVIVLAFQPVFADNVALMIVDELRQIQFRFADFSHIPCHMRGKPVLRILPPPGLDQLHLRVSVRILMGFDPGDLIPRKFDL